VCRFSSLPLCASSINFGNTILLGTIRLGVYCRRTLLLGDVGTSPVTTIRAVIFVGHVFTSSCCYIRRARLEERMWTCLLVQCRTVSASGPWLWSLLTFAPYMMVVPGRGDMHFRLGGAEALSKILERHHDGAFRLYQQGGI
jgi:hypothetical protein